HVLLELRQNGTPLGHIFFDPVTAEKHTRDVARARAALNDPVIPDLDIGFTLDATIDPRWWVPYERSAVGGRVLCLRHPGLGWLAFSLPEHEAAAMAQALVKELPSPQQAEDIAPNASSE